MTRKPIRVLAACAAIVIAGFAVAAVSRDDQPAKPALVDTSHGEVKLAKGEMQRILNAADATTSGAAADELAAQGRTVFRDASLFEDGESCQTCHAEGTTSARLGTMVHDKSANQSLSPTPPNDFDGPRDAPSLIDLAKTAPYFWDGDVPTLEAAIVRPIKGHMKMFQTGACKSDATTQACVAEVALRTAQLTAYVKTLTPPTTSFDEGTMSDAARAGEKLFQGKGGCIECHGGPDFTDNLVHNTGVPQVKFDRYDGDEATSKDLGCANVTSSRPVACAVAAPECAGANPPAGCAVEAGANTGAGSAFINTPMLRDLGNSAPYMHNGAFKNLTDVVNFYNTQSTLAPLNLSPTEVSELVAYLNSL